MSSSRASPTSRDSFPRFAAVLFGIISLAALISIRYLRKTQANVLVLDMKHRQMSSELAALKISLDSLDGNVRKSLASTTANDVGELKTTVTSLRDDVKKSVNTLKDEVVGARKATAEDAGRVQSLAAQLSDSFTASAALRRRVDRQQQQMDSVQELLESMQAMAGPGGGQNLVGNGGHIQQQAQRSRQQGSGRAFSRSLIGGKAADATLGTSGRRQDGAIQEAAVNDISQVEEEDLRGDEGANLLVADQDAMAKMRLVEGHRGIQKHLTAADRKAPQLSSNSVLGAELQAVAMGLPQPGRQGIDHNLQEFAAGSLQVLPAKTVEAAQTVGTVSSSGKGHAQKAVQDLHKAVQQAGITSGGLGRKGNLKNVNAVSRDMKLRKLLKEQGSRQGHGTHCRRSI